MSRPSQVGWVRLVSLRQVIMYAYNNKSWKIRVKSQKQIQCKFKINPSQLQSRRRQWQPTTVTCLENPMDGGAWWAAVHGVTESRTWLSDLTFPFHFHALEKEMAAHSSVLAWRIPGTGKPGGLHSMGSHRVRHNWSDSAAAVTVIATIETI